MADYGAWVSAFEQQPRWPGGEANEAAGGGSDDGALPGAELPREGDEDRLLEAVMLRLRLAEGLDMRWVGREFGQEAAGGVAASLLRHEAAALVAAERGADDALLRLRLTAPEGFLVSNAVISDVWAAVSS